MAVQSKSKSRAATTATKTARGRRRASPKVDASFEEVAEPVTEAVVTESPVEPDESSMTNDQLAALIAKMQAGQAPKKQGLVQKYGSLIFVAALFLGYIAWKDSRGSVAPSPSPAAPAVVTTDAVNALKQVVAKADQKHVIKLGHLFAAWAEVLSRAEPISSAALRNGLISADSYMIRGTDLQGAVPGFGAAKDAVLIEAIGKEDRLLTKEEMAKVVEACKSIAKACGA
jgi:hypothetical protein